MIVRTAVAVALAVGLVAASVPVVERARVDHSTATIAGEVERLERSAVALAAGNEVVPDGGSPARTRVTLSLPIRSWAESGVEAVRIQNGTGGPDVEWTATGGATRYRTFPDVRVSGPADGLAIGEGGRQRLVLSLERRGDNRTVVVRRPDADRAGAGA